ncbi:MAG: hypothetical protein Unbinned4234contig1002_22 [Prokaryotic dsDNA virus sp.]|jgi:hypothetical protein|nr:MAG: hypothetical protein Unbinned4234contig1002_22 [Prokaryotic dsDNA virus sp.]|tara:strand:- start:2593 stop:3069 length:477 start_codon:yes stop_codon:yes gene_type:complete
MKFKLVKNLVGSLAPTIGSALGGPIGGMAANLVAEVLGCDPEPKKIEQAISNATPEQLLQLKKAEKEFEAKMKEMDVDIFALETADIQDARKTFSGDWTPKLLGTITLFGFFGYIFMISIYPLPDASDDIVMLIIGSLTGIATAVISFYFGSSHKDTK